MPRSLFAILHHRFATPARRDADRERRRFLIASAAAAAGLAAAPLQALAARARRPENARPVVVVGAGLAGLACAHRLHTLGVPVRVIDARNRVGGRTVTLRTLLPGADIDAGGEFVGANHPCWNALAAQLGLSLREVPDEPGDAPILLNGRRLGPGEAERLYAEMAPILARAAVESAAVNPDEPWKSQNAADLDRRSVADWIAAQPCSALCRLALRVQFETDNGVSAERQSLLAFYAMVHGGGRDAFWTDSETHRCVGGAQTLAEALAAALPETSLTLGVAATRIDFGADHTAPPIVTLADDRRIEAADVVLAVPPSVWRRVEVRPAQTFAMTPQMAGNTKWLALLGSRVWRAESRSPDALADGLVNMTWDAAAGQTDDAGPTVLTAFTGAGSAERLRAVPRAERDAALSGELDALFPGFSAALQAARFVDWPADTFARGSYTFPAPGQTTALLPRLRAAAAPHLAGEHLSSAFPGYMEGALESGLRVAERLLAR